MTKLVTNKKLLIKQSVQGEIAAPVIYSPYDITHMGKPVVLPGVGGITYNLQLGDLACGWAVDHVEPGVSIHVPGDKRGENAALNTFACIGNEAVVVSGDAKGVKGFVTGKHGGIEHVLVYFPEPELEKMCHGDKILIKGWGQGMELLNCPEVKVMNLDPELLEKLNPQLDGYGNLLVEVAAVIPAYLMGSGIGAASACRGDYDIMTADREAVRQFHLDKLRLGDIVYLQDCDNSFGRGYLKGAGSIGVVVHSDCVIAGHGPGVTVIMTSKIGRIKPVISREANIAFYLGVKNPL